MNAKIHTVKAIAADFGIELSDDAARNAVREIDAQIADYHYGDQQEWYYVAKEYFL